jgi:hypothetical protein
LGQEQPAVGLTLQSGEHRRKKSWQSVPAGQVLLDVHKCPSHAANPMHASCPSVTRRHWQPTPCPTPQSALGVVPAGQKLPHAPLMQSPLWHCASTVQAPPVGTSVGTVHRPPWQVPAAPPVAVQAVPSPRIEATQAPASQATAWH